MKNWKLTNRQLTVLFVVFLSVSSVLGLCGFLAGRALYGGKLRNSD